MKYWGSGFSIKNLEDNSDLHTLLKRNKNHILAIHLSEINQQDSLKFIKIYDVFINLKMDKIDINVSGNHSIKMMFKFDDLKKRYEFYEIIFE